MSMIRRGVVRRFSHDRGYGFVVPVGVPPPDTRDADIFVHFSQVLVSPQTLMIGQLVEFEIEDRPDRPGQKQATRVRVLPPESEPTGLRF